MNHTTSAIAVFRTTEYSRFKNVNGNRPLNKQKIKKIIKEIESGNDILDHVPVLVGVKDEKLLVYDGQHRIEIARQLKRPVHYIIRPEMSLHDVAKVNSNVEKWKSADFINCYITAGNQNYRKIESFMSTYGMPLSLTLVLLANGVIKSDSGKETLIESFQRGEFEVKKWKQAVEVAETCKKFETFHEWNSRAFGVAICRLLESDMCDFEELVDKFSKDPKALEKQHTYKQYLVNLEQIYNKGNHKRRAIY